MQRSISVCGRSVRAMTPAVLLWTAAVCAAQKAPQFTDYHYGMNQVDVRGEVSSEGDREESGLTIELVSSERRLAGRAQVGLSGDFDVQNVEPGDYELRVLDSRQQVIRSEFVTVSENENNFSVRLPEQPLSKQPVRGTVSLSQLKRKIPPKALKEFRKAEASHAAGNDQQSIEHLDRALELYPDFAEAHSNLGIRYLRLRQYPQAVEHLRKAVELAPACGPAFTNLSAALFELREYPDAEQAARQALRLNGADDKARMLLGLSLASGGGKDEEALRQLKAVATEFPRVRLAIADLLVQQGHPRKAAVELKEYLTAGKVDNRGEVETWINRLEQGLPAH